MVSTPIQLVEDYLRSLRILREFSQEDETIEGVMLFSKAVERIIMENPTWFKDFLFVVQKHLVEIVTKHNGALPIAYYFERFLKYGDSKEFLD